MSKLKSPWGDKTTLVIILFLVALGWMFTTEAKAETSMDVTAYATSVGGEFYQSEALSYTERWDDKYELGILLQLRLECQDDSACRRGESLGSNQAIYIQRVTHYKDVEMSFGISYWHKESPAWNSHTPYMLGIGYRINDDWTINYKHFSTGGSSTNNGGLDYVSIRYNFN